MNSFFASYKISYINSKHPPINYFNENTVNISLFAFKTSEIKFDGFFSIFIIKLIFTKYKIKL